ncbi:MAG: NAD(P)H-dependent oxidoreductase, partial [Mesorhizobium sp.]
SFALFEGGPEIALLGKKPAEMEAILAEPEKVLAMRNALSGFADFIRSP